MSIQQFANSIVNIKKRSNINTLFGVAKHGVWQIRRIFNLFPFTQQISQSKIIAQDPHCGVSALINSSDMYDFNNMSLIRLVLGSMDRGVFFDVGANIGSYSLVASEISKAEIVAFEPHPETFNKLSKNIKLNERKNVKLMNLGLDKESGELDFMNTGISATNHIVRNVDDEAKEDILSVECVRADKFCESNSLVPNVMKIDVEGFEYDVLCGFGDMLSEINIILLEINGLSAERNASEDDILELLYKQGFIGPMSFDFRKLEFDKYKFGTLEDPVFVNKKLLKGSEVYFNSLLNLKCQNL